MSLGRWGVGSIPVRRNNGGEGGGSSPIHPAEGQKNKGTFLPEDILVALDEPNMKLQRMTNSSVHQEWFVEKKGGGLGKKMTAGGTKMRPETVIVK